MPPEPRTENRQDQAPHVGQPGRIVAPARAQLVTPEGAPVTAAAQAFDPEAHEGRVVAFPAVFGRAFRMGFFTYHRIEPGAFTESLAEQPSIPIYVQHNWDWTERPPVGWTTAHEEAELPGDENDDDGNPLQGIRLESLIDHRIDDGLAVLNGLMAGALREWSIGYMINEFRVEEDDDNGRRIVHIERAELWEASVVLRGANPWTRTLEVASAPQLHAPRPPDSAMAELVEGEVQRQLAARQRAEAEFFLAGAGAGDPEPHEDVYADLAASSPSFRAALARLDT